MNFMIERSNFYYEVMSFSLENTGTTYQRLMGLMFKGLIGQSVIVYVDDLVVKFDLLPHV